MNKLTHIIFTLAFLISGMLSYGQSTHLERQVIGSTGNFSKGSNLHLSSTVGEPITPTGSSANYVLTQGFHQPRVMVFDPLAVSTSTTNSSCKGASNGIVSIDTITGCLAPYSIQWNTPDEDTTKVVTGLPYGDYVVTVTGSANCTYTDTVTIGLESENSCELHIYSGITPNGDGNNDIWVIDNIHLDNYQPNSVSIYNRWGKKVWSAENYNNQDIVWKGTNQNGDLLSDATYYYVVEIGEGNIHKGWVEITR